MICSEANAGTGHIVCPVTDRHLKPLPGYTGTPAAGNMVRYPIYWPGAWVWNLGMVLAFMYNEIEKNEYRFVYKRNRYRGDRVSKNDQSRLRMRMTEITDSLRAVFQTKKKIVLISIALAAGVLVTLICIWAVLMLFRDEPAQKNASVNGSERQMQTGAADSDSGPVAGKVQSNIFVLDPFEKIPLKNSKTMGYLNLHIAIDLADPGFSDLLNRDLYEVRQVIEETAGEMSWFQLRSPEGKINLKYNLIKKINSLYTGTVVQNLYFTSFLMQ